MMNMFCSVLVCTFWTSPASPHVATCWRQPDSSTKINVIAKPPVLKFGVRFLTPDHGKCQVKDIFTSKSNTGDHFFISYKSSARTNLFGLCKTVFVFWACIYKVMRRRNERRIVPKSGPECRENDLLLWRIYQLDSRTLFPAILFLNFRSNPLILREQYNCHDPEYLVRTAILQRIKVSPSIQKKTMKVNLEA